jgi:hypothetical protein
MNDYDVIIIHRVAPEDGIKLIGIMGLSLFIICAAVERSLTLNGYEAAATALSFIAALVLGGGALGLVWWLGRKRQIGHRNARESALA